MLSRTSDISTIQLRGNHPSSGAATHYGVEIEITENECVLHGDPACVFTVEGRED